MGTDNLFHKRKERTAGLLRRRRAMKASYDVILIVCEGAKTEPNYFTELKNAFRLSNANVMICGRGSDPLSVVDFAIETCGNRNLIASIVSLTATGIQHTPLPWIR